MPTRWRIDVVSNTPPTLAMFQMRTSIRLLATLPTFFSMLSRSVFKCMRRQNVKSWNGVARISDSVTRIIDHIYWSKRSVGFKPRQKNMKIKHPCRNDTYATDEKLNIACISIFMWNWKLVFEKTPHAHALCRLPPAKKRACAPRRRECIRTAHPRAL